MANIGYLKNKEDIRLYLSSFYPVGAIYIFAVECNPEEMFGGKWEAFATGRTLVGIDTSQAEFNTALKTGGNKNLQQHSHHITARGVNDSASTSTALGQYPIRIYQDKNSNWPVYNNIWNTDNAGSGNSGNLQPYITVYVYRRVS